MYKVIKYFTDLQDNNHPYNVGDDYPREGLKVTEERIAELSSDRNKRKVPLIEIATSQEEPKEEPKAEPKEKPQEEVEKNDRSGSSKNAKSKPGKKKQLK